MNTVKLVFTLLYFGVFLWIVYQQAVRPRPAKPVPVRAILTEAEQKARARKYIPWVMLAGAILVTCLALAFPLSWPIALFLYYRLYCQMRLAQKELQ